MNTQIQLHQHIKATEEVLWEGTPNPSFSITFLEVGGNLDVFIQPLSIVGLPLAGIIWGGYHFYTQENWVGFVLTLVVGIFTLLIPDFIKYYRKKNTFYAVTNERIYFQLWRWGKTKIHSIPLTDITKMTFEEHQDDSGVIYFSTEYSLNFFTYDFLTSNRRFYPTFEMIPNVAAVYKRITALKKTVKHG